LILHAQGNNRFVRLIHLQKMQRKQ